MTTHKDLEVWKNSIDLVTRIYQITENFPKEELYGLVSQIRRSSVSLPSNISEGAGRNYKKEYIQFLYIAMGSLSELETQIIISKNLALLSKEDFQELNERMNLIRSQLSGLIHYLKIK
ncbi:MAG: four helix bundle protein [Bacteroidales bacterium]|nr:four helix bundle protein [Bacteroidales bacterium]